MAKSSVDVANDIMFTAGYHTEVFSTDIVSPLQGTLRDVWILHDIDASSESPTWITDRAFDTLGELVDSKAVLNTVATT